MLRPALVAGILALVLGSVTTAASQPSERACLITWNSAANRANHARLLALRPIVELSLRAGVAGTDTWTKTTHTHTSGPACLMTVIKRGEQWNVTGMWKGVAVPRWTFAHGMSANKNYPPPGFANVRLLADGRVTKIYRR